jgi:hypothetical protein
MLLLALALALVTPATSWGQEAGRGTLTLVVRDPTGTRLAGVTVALYHDTDLDGRVLIDTRATDQAGQLVYPDLPWGLYIVQFRGVAPDGRAILPPAQQNLGLLDDGSGIGDGFGVRFVELEATSLFVLGSSPDTPNAVPMFDLAPNPDAPPEPIDPLLAIMAPGPTPTPFSLAAALAAQAQPTPRRALDTTCLWGMGLLLWLGAILVCLGWVRSRRPVLPPKEDHHERLG